MMQLGYEKEAGRLKSNKMKRTFPEDLEDSEVFLITAYFRE